MGKLERKKEAKLVHPNSRKAAAIVKQKIRSARREHKKEQGHQYLRLLSERLVWFRDHLPAEQKRFTLEETHQLIEQYIERHAAEVAQLRQRAAPRGPVGRRPPRPPQRLTALEATRTAETAEFTQGGIEIADLTDEDAVLYLRAWDGQVKLVPQIKTKRFIRGRLVEPTATSASDAGREMAAESEDAEEAAVDSEDAGEDVTAESAESAESEDAGRSEDDDMAADG